MCRLLFFVVAALCIIGSQSKAEPQPKPKPDPNPGVLSVLKKSTTLFPNHYTTQVSALNMDPARSYYNSYNPLLQQANPLLQQANPLLQQANHLLYYNYLNTLPYLNALQPYYGAPPIGPSYYNRNLYNPAFHHGGLHSNYDHHKNLLSYTLSPEGDGGWSFLDGEPLTPPAVNLLRYTNPYNGWAVAGVYPGLLPQLGYPLPATVALAGGNLYPFNDVFNLSALDRLKWNAKYLVDEAPYQQPGAGFDRSQIISAAVHNAQALGKSKEAEYSNINKGD